MHQALIGAGGERMRAVGGDSGLVAMRVCPMAWVPAMRLNPKRWGDMIRPPDFLKICMRRPLPTTRTAGVLPPEQEVVTCLCTLTTTWVSCTA